MGNLLASINYLASPCDYILERLPSAEITNVLLNSLDDVGRHPIKPGNVTCSLKMMSGIVSAADLDSRTLSSGPFEWVEIHVIFESGSGGNQVEKIHETC